MCIDFLTSLPDFDFATCWEKREIDESGGFSTLFLSKEDLIAAKEKAGRPQDLADIDELGGLKIDGASLRGCVSDSVSLVRGLTAAQQSEQISNFIIHLACVGDGEADFLAQDVAKFPAEFKGGLLPAFGTFSVSEQFLRRGLFLFH